MRFLFTDNVLFLDDSPERCKAFRSAFPSATIVTTAEECIQKLQDDVFDVVCLDHDLGDKVYVQVGTSGHGGDVVRWIVENKPRIRDVIIHSMNEPASEWMEATLQDAGYTVLRRSFPLLKADIS